MREPIETYFQMGTIQWMSYPGEPVLESLRKILCDDFFSAVEVCQAADDDTRKAMRDMLAQSHVKVCYGAQPRLLGPGLNPNDIVEENRLKAEKTLLEAIDEAEYLGAKGIAFLAGNGRKKPRRKRLPSF